MAASLGQADDESFDSPPIGPPAHASLAGPFFDALFFHPDAASARAAAETLLGRLRGISTAYSPPPRSPGGALRKYRCSTPQVAGVVIGYLVTKLPGQLQLAGGDQLIEQLRGMQHRVRSRGFRQDTRFSAYCMYAGRW